MHLYITLLNYTIIIYIIFLYYALPLNLNNANKCNDKLIIWH